jgi:membrane protein implicated in regulation of membrane protease activity
MAWWLWMLLGLALVAAELVGAGGFYLVFFGVGGLLVGILAMLDLAGPPGVQWLAFSLISVISALLFRKPLLHRFQRGMPKKREPGMVGEPAVALESIAAGDVGRAELRGTTWSARNVDSVTLEAGARCVVERIDGLVIGLRRA